VAETLTPNYGWTKPDPGASANTWGATLNATTDKVDAQVFANQTSITQRGVEVGSGALWFTATPPTNWLICDGSSLDTTTYAKLFAVIGYGYGGSGANFNLPPLLNAFPLGGSVGATGGEAAHTLTVDELAPHPHSISDPSHTHGAYQNAHTHSANQNPHAHRGTVDSHAHGPGNLMKFTGSGGSLGVGSTPFNVGEGTTDAAAPGLSTDTQQPGVNIDTQQPGVGVYGNYTGINGTNNAGGGAAHNNMPPWVGVNFIIKYQ
jgi:microcystin-dependent protein